jgi:predicted kinase
MPELILVRGIPGSGKSTLAKTLMYFRQSVDYADFDHFEADQFFIDQKTGKYNFDASKLNQAHNWCLDQTREGLTRNAVVYVSNTFTTKRELKPYFEMAKEFGIVPVVYLAQNQFNNVHNVPEDKLQAMRDRFQYDITELFAE